YRLVKIYLPLADLLLSAFSPLMSLNQRKHIRFSLDIPAILITKYGEKQHTLLQQISIGGCFTDWEENIYAGDEFRLEIELPNKNRLPLSCKAVYRFEDTGIGVKFLNISQFEQELISKIIAHRMDAEGVPLSVSPFEEPTTFAIEEPRIITPREQREEMLSEVMASE
ncbi:MAG TPA: PilZ domain-containing protein, partial [Pyrinomonadaceae bacterium]|nr:PilZ domain-containing protein [Pyrinomonadaceae bacterium]